MFCPTVRISSMSPEGVWNWICAPVSPAGCHSQSAREALPARLVLAEGDEQAGHVNGAGPVVGDYDAAGAKDGARLLHCVEVQGDVKPLRRQQAAKGAARLEELACLPPGTPPTTSSMTSRRVMPIGTSTMPGNAMLPDRHRIAVPLLLSVPISANHSPPLAMISARRRVS